VKKDLVEIEDFILDKSEEIQEMMPPEYTKF
jgi:hypothetical protein